MENRFSDLPNEIFRQIPMEIGKDKKPRSPLENLLGIGIVGGATDLRKIKGILRRQRRYRNYSKSPG